MTNLKEYTEKKLSKSLKKDTTLFFITKEKK